MQGARKGASGPRAGDETQAKKPALFKRHLAAPKRARDVHLPPSVSLPSALVAAKASGSMHPDRLRMISAASADETTDAALPSSSSSSSSSTFQARIRHPSSADEGENARQLSSSARPALKRRRGVGDEEDAERGLHASDERRALSEQPGLVSLDHPAEKEREEEKEAAAAAGAAAEAAAAAAVAAAAVAASAVRPRDKRLRLASRKKTLPVATVLRRADIPIVEMTAVEWGVLSSKRIREMSVVRVTSVATSAQREFVEGGLCDLKMGAIDRSRPCATCFSGFRDDIGHPGHFRIEYPIILYTFIDPLYRVLRSVCFVCSRILLPKGSAKRARGEALPFDQRLAYFSKQGHESKYCGVPPPHLPRRNGRRAVAAPLDRSLFSDALLAALAPCPREDALTAPPDPPPPRSRQRKSKRRQRSRVGASLGEEAKNRHGDQRDDDDDDDENDHEKDDDDDDDDDKNVAEDDDEDFEAEDEWDDEPRPHCGGCIQPVWTIQEHNIVASWDHVPAEQRPHDHTRWGTPARYMRITRGISRKDCATLGCPTRPCNFVQTDVMIPPNTLRPALEHSEGDGSRGHSELTGKFKSMLSKQLQLADLRAEILSKSATAAAATGFVKTLVPLRDAAAAAAAVATTSSSSSSSHSPASAACAAPLPRASKRRKRQGDANARGRSEELRDLTEEVTIRRSEGKDAADQDGDEEDQETPSTEDEDDGGEDDDDEDAEKHDSGGSTRRPTTATATVAAAVASELKRATRKSSTSKAAQNRKAQSNAAGVGGPEQTLSRKRTTAKRNRLTAEQARDDLVDQLGYELAAYADSCAKMGSGAALMSGHADESAVTSGAGSATRTTTTTTTTTTSAAATSATGLGTGAMLPRLKAGGRYGKDMRNVTNAMTAAAAGGGSLPAGAAVGSASGANGRRAGASGGSGGSGGGAARAMDRESRASQGVKQKMDGKRGYLRSNCGGRRVKQSGRNVIGPDQCLDADEVSTSRECRVRLTVGERAFQGNFHRLLRVARQGPALDDGARFVIESRSGDRSDGDDEDEGDNVIRRDLRFTDPRRTTLRIGSRVLRPPGRGDWLLVNRQPSLQKQSIMAHREKGLARQAGRPPGHDRNASTTGIPPATCGAYSGDFDGDEMNKHVPGSERAEAEAAVLMAVGEQIVSARHGGALIYPVQNSLLAAWDLTGPECELSRDDAFQLLNHAKCWDGRMPRRLRCSPREAPRYAGRAVFSALLPRNLSLRDDATGMIVRRGRLLRGRVDKKCMARLVRVIVADCGAAVAIAFVSGACHALAHWLSRIGATVSIDDLENPAPKRTALLARVVSEFFRDTPFRDPAAARPPLDGKPRHLARADCKDQMETEVAESNRDEAAEKKAEDMDEEEDEEEKEEEEEEELAAAAEAKEQEEEASGDLDEAKVMQVLDTLPGQVAEAIKSAVRRRGQRCPSLRPGMFEVVSARIRGELSNLVQLVAVAGQQRSDNRRLEAMPHYSSEECRRMLVTRGMVFDAYADGITPGGYWSICVQTHVDLCGIAASVPETGYLERKLVKANEDVIVRGDRSVRGANGAVFQLLACEDGLDPTRVEISAYGPLAPNKAAPPPDPRASSSSSSSSASHLQENVPGWEARYAWSAADLVAESHRAKWDETRNRERLACVVNELRQLRNDRAALVHGNVGGASLPSAVPFARLVLRHSDEKQARESKRRAAARAKSQKRTSEAGEEGEDEKEAKEEKEAEEEEDEEEEEEATERADPLQIAETVQYFLLWAQRSGWFGQIEPDGRAAPLDGLPEADKEADTSRDKERTLGSSLRHPSHSSLRHASHSSHRHASHSSSPQSQSGVLPSTNTTVCPANVAGSKGAYETTRRVAPAPVYFLEALIRDWFSTRRVVCEYRWDHATLVRALRDVEDIQCHARIAPGEAIGVLTSQAIAEPTTQMVLNKFRAAMGSEGMGIDRIKDIVNATKSSAMGAPSTMLQLTCSRSSVPSLENRVRLEERARRICHLPLASCIRSYRIRVLERPSPSLSPASLSSSAMTLGDDSDAAIKPATPGIVRQAAMGMGARHDSDAPSARTVSEIAEQAAMDMGARLALDIELCPRQLSNYGLTPMRIARRLSAKTWSRDRHFWSATVAGDASVPPRITLMPDETGTEFREKKSSSSSSSSSSAAARAKVGAMAAAAAAAAATTETAMSALQSQAQSQLQLPASVMLATASLLATERVLENAARKMLRATVAGMRCVRSAQVVESLARDGTTRLAVRTQDEVGLGSNLGAAMQPNWVNARTSTTTDLHSIAASICIEAAKESWDREIQRVVEHSNETVDRRYTRLAAQVACHTGVIQPFTRYGVISGKSVFHTASFEKSFENMASAAALGKIDRLRGVTENIIVGKRVEVGTGMCNATIVCKPPSLKLRAENAEVMARRTLYSSYDAPDLATQHLQPADTLGVTGQVPLSVVLPPVLRTTRGAVRSSIRCLLSVKRRREISLTRARQDNVAGTRNDDDTNHLEEGEQDDGRPMTKRMFAGSDAHARPGGEISDAQSEADALCSASQFGAESFVENAAMEARAESALASSATDAAFGARRGRPLVAPHIVSDLRERAAQAASDALMAAHSSESAARESLRAQALQAQTAGLSNFVAVRGAGLLQPTTRFSPATGIMLYVRALRSCLHCPNRTFDDICGACKIQAS